MIGYRLALLRKNKKMVQKDLAKILGVTKHSISLYENDKTSPSDKCYVLLAKTFNVSVDYLLGLVDKPHSYERTEQSTVALPEGVPHEIKLVIDEFLEYVKTKYSCETAKKDVIEPE